MKSRNRRRQLYLRLGCGVRWWELLKVERCESTVASPAGINMGSDVGLFACIGVR